MFEFVHTIDREKATVWNLRIMAKVSCLSFSIDAIWQMLYIFSYFISGLPYLDGEIVIKS